MNYNNYREIRTTVLTNSSQEHIHKKDGFDLANIGISSFLTLLLVVVAVKQFSLSKRQNKIALLDKQFKILNDIYEINKVSRMMKYQIETALNNRLITEEEFESGAKGLTQKSFNHLIKNEGLDKSEYKWDFLHEGQEEHINIAIRENLYQNARYNMLNIHQRQSDYLHEISILFKKISDENIIILMQSIQESFSYILKENEKLSAIRKEAMKGKILDANMIENKYNAVLKNLMKKLEEVEFMSDYLIQNLKFHMDIRNPFIDFIKDKYKKIFNNEYRKSIKLHKAYIKLRKKQMNVRKIWKDTYIGNQKKYKKYFDFANNNPWKNK